MKTLDLNLTITVAESLEELSLSEQELIKEAIAATDNSYSRYSHFSVGAAIRLVSGRIVRGANQENASYGMTMCAERSAIFAAQSWYPDESITTLAIAARNETGALCDDPIAPCGACRQVILEMEDRYKQPIRILLYGKKSIYIADTVKTILPLTFTGDSML